MDQPISGVRTAAHVVQVAVYGVMAWGAAAIWWVDGAVLLAAGAGQAVAAVGGRRADAAIYRLGNQLSLLAVLLVLSRHLAQAAHVMRTFGELAGASAWGAVGNLLLTLPWALAVPIVALWPVRRASAAVLAGLVPLLGALQPYPAWSAEALPADVAVQVARAAWGGWTAGGATTAPLPADALVLLTPVRRGKASATRCARGPDLGPTLAALERPDAGSALIVDVAVQHLPAGWLRAGTDAPAAACPRSPAILAREGLTEGGVMHGLDVARADGPAIRFHTALASAEGVVALDAGWTPGPPVDRDRLRAAVAAGAHHLARNQAADGRFTYIVHAPSGVGNKGYNWPRHAGTAWFLARAAIELDDASLRDAARRAVAYAGQHTGWADGRAFVNDPTRKDGRSWIGTTALIALAAIDEGSDPALRDGWLLQIAASVDEDGRVRSETDVATGQILPSETTAYGQGQGMLALANAVRHLGADVPSIVPSALDRALGFLASGDYAGSARPWAVGDEHWMCLVAHAAEAARGPDHEGVKAAHAICAAYLFEDRTPPRRDGHRPKVNGAGGLAEAVVAHAWDTGSAVYREVAYGYADLFLASQYQPADAPLLGKPTALIGGFRTSPGELDVQIDTVQHASCALLGVLAFEDGDRRARLP